MDDAMRELGRRAIAKGWRWMSGSLSDEGKRVTQIGSYRGEVDVEAWESGGYSWEGSEAFVGPTEIPDFSDPATIGCLLHQVRERWGDEWLHVAGSYSHDGVVWRVCAGKPHGAGFRRTADQLHPTEAAALVSALEAAPKVTP